MCKGFFSKIKAFFTKNDSASTSIDVNVSTEIKKIKKSKKMNNSVDRSDDHSTNVNGDYNLNSNNSITYYNNMITKDLILYARWNNLVPCESEQLKKGLDEIRVLQTVDRNFLPAQLEIKYDESINNVNAIYFLIKQNNFIKNLYIKSLKLECNDLNIELTTPKDLFALLDEDRSFIVVHNKFKIGEGTLTIVLGFEQDNGKFYQEFVFKVSNDSSKFILQKYNNPIFDVNLCHFKPKV